MEKQPRYYIELVLPEEKDVQAIGRSHVISYLHSCNKRNSWNIGMDFPKETKEGLGDLVRLFSYNKENLTFLLNSKKIDQLKAIHAIARTSRYVQEVPEGTREMLVFRNNQVEKRQIGYWLKKKYSESEALELIEKFSTVEVDVHLIHLYSSKSGKAMKRYLHRVEAKHRADGEFNSYGYSAKDSLVTVPFF